jgi:hypothetical protein
MHAFHVFALFAVVTLVGVEFTVSAFINPAAWRLAPEPQKELLGRLALVLGRVMPVWYPATAVLIAVETWLHWTAASRPLFLAALVLWALACIGSIFFLVPLNTRIAQGAADWQQLHHTWDSRHRIRIATLAAGALALLYALIS